MISATEGNARTQFQSRSSHSRFTISAKANPTHHIAKITMAYVLSTRGTVTLQNDESLIVALPDLQEHQPDRNVPGPEEDNPLAVQSSTLDNLSVTIETKDIYASVVIVPWPSLMTM